MSLERLLSPWPHARVIKSARTSRMIKYYTTKDLSQYEGVVAAAVAFGPGPMPCRSGSTFEQLYSMQKCSSVNIAACNTLKSEV